MKEFLELILLFFKGSSKKELDSYKEENIEAEELVPKKPKEVEEPMPDIEFKTPRVEKEYAELEDKNRPLYDLSIDLQKFVWDEFEKKLTITMINRTAAEQDYLYKNSAKYQKKKFKSPHQYLHSLDIRSRNFDSAEIKKIEDYLNKKYNDANYYSWTAKNHTVGSGLHFHIQLYEV